MSSNCTGWWTGLGEAWGKKCWLETGHGTRNLETGIRDSCDVVFYDLGKNFFYSEKNPEGLQEMYRRWGLGAKTGIDLPPKPRGVCPILLGKRSTARIGVPTSVHGTPVI